MSAPKVGQEGLKGAGSAQKTQNNGARTICADLWHQSDFGDECGNTSFLGCSDHPQVCWPAQNGWL